MKNCFEGYLTKACKNCEFWADGSGHPREMGCSCPFPIMACPAFAEEYERAERERQQEESEK